MSASGREGEPVGRGCRARGGRRRRTRRTGGQVRRLERPRPGRDRRRSAGSPRQSLGRGSDGCVSCEVTPEPLTPAPPRPGRTRPARFPGVRRLGRRGPRTMARLRGRSRGRAPASRSWGLGVEALNASSGRHGGDRRRPSGRGVRPACPRDQAHFEQRFRGWTLVPDAPDYNEGNGIDPIRFIGPGRFETGGLEGSYEYQGTGADTGTLTLTVDLLPIPQMSDLTLDSRTTGTFTAGADGLRRRLRVRRLDDARHDAALPRRRRGDGRRRLGDPRRRRGPRRGRFPSRPARVGARHWRRRATRLLAGLGLLGVLLVLLGRRQQCG